MYAKSLIAPDGNSSTSDWVLALKAGLKLGAGYAGENWQAGVRAFADSPYAHFDEVELQWLAQTVELYSGVSGIEGCSSPPALAQQRSNPPDPVRPHARQWCSPMPIGLHVGSLSASPGAAQGYDAPSLLAGHNGGDAYRQ